jgi:hypothetical protein
MEAPPEYTNEILSPPSLHKALKATAAEGSLAPYAFSKKGALLGAGFTGKVYRVYNTLTGEVCAAKFFPNNISSQWDAQIFAAAARCLEGRGVVPEFKGRYYVCGGAWLVVVMSLLVPILRGEIGAYARYAQSMRRCLREFHDAGFAHGDIHLENFMVDPNTDTVRIIDFGLSYDYRDTVENRWFLPRVPRGKRFPDIKNWSWITSRIDPTSLDSLRVADYLIDTTKLEYIIEMLGL